MEYTKVLFIKPVALKTAQGFELFDYSDIVYIKCERNFFIVTILGQKQTSV